MGLETFLNNLKYFFLKNAIFEILLPKNFKTILILIDTCLFFKKIGHLGFIW